MIPQRKRISLLISQLFESKDVEEVPVMVYPYYDQVKAVRVKIREDAFNNFFLGDGIEILYQGEDKK